MTTTHLDGTSRYGSAAAWVLLVMGLQLLLAPPALACRCSTPTLEEAFARADAVFEAKILSLGPRCESPTEPVRDIRQDSGDPSPRDPWSLLQGSCGGQRVELLITRSWKGNVGEPSTIRTSRGGACGYSFEKGRQYLIFAFRDKEGLLWTDICTRTRAAKDARQDLRNLKKLRTALAGE